MEGSWKVFIKVFIIGSYGALNELLFTVLTGGAFRSFS